MLEQRKNEKVSHPQTAHLHERKNLKVSPYFLQYKNFEDRLKGKCSRTKYNSLFLKNSQLKGLSEKEQNLLTKQIQNLKNKWELKNKFFNFDHQNVLDLQQLCEESDVQISLINKTKDKLRKRKSIGNENVITSSSRAVSQAYTQDLLRVGTQPRIANIEMKLKKFANYASFLNYKKNKQAYLGMLQ